MTGNIDYRTLPHWQRDANCSFAGYVLAYERHLGCPWEDGNQVAESVRAKAARQALYLAPPNGLGVYRKANPRGGGMNVTKLLPPLGRYFRSGTIGPGHDSDDEPGTFVGEDLKVVLRKHPGLTLLHALCFAPERQLAALGLFEGTLRGTLFPTVAKQGGAVALLKRADPVSLRRNKAVVVPEKGDAYWDDHEWDDKVVVEPVPDPEPAVEPAPEIGAPAVWDSDVEFQVHGGVPPEAVTIVGRPAHVSYEVGDGCEFTTAHLTGDWRVLGSGGFSKRDRKWLHALHRLNPGARFFTSRRHQVTATLALPSSLERGDWQLEAGTPKMLRERALRGHLVGDASLYRPNSDYRGAWLPTVTKSILTVYRTEAPREPVLAADHLPPAPSITAQSVVTTVTTTDASSEWTTLSAVCTGGRNCSCAECRPRLLAGGRTITLGLGGIVVISLVNVTVSVAAITLLWREADRKSVV